MKASNATCILFNNDMNPNIQKLFSIAGKPSRLIIGLMSGTSLDGLDIALCRITGAGSSNKVELLNFQTVGYSNVFKQEIKEVFAQKHIELEKLCLLNPRIALQHAAMIKDFLNRINITSDKIDLLASHGQTIYHAPQRFHPHDNAGDATLQLGDGDHLAVATGIITISDFRQKHIAAGGEGAPLAVYGDRILFSASGEDRILLNIGGIANFTFLPADQKDEKVLCTDVGPGNTIMDALMQKHYPEKHFDEGAAIAKKGIVNDALLSALKEDDFFKQAFPKTTGPELFNLNYLAAAQQKTNTVALSIADTMATLNKFSADMIIDAINASVKNKSNVKIFVSGGGMHNPLLMRYLTEQLSDCSFHSTAELGIDPDAKEAVLFAILANECICVDPTLKNNKIDGIPAVAMGKISFPY